MVSADYSQMELRLAAHLSDDQHIISILRSVGADGDVFKMLASHWLDKQIEEVSDEERQTVKRISCEHPHSPRLVILSDVSAFLLILILIAVNIARKRTTENIFRLC